MNHTGTLGCGVSSRWRAKLLLTSLTSLTCLLSLWAGPALGAARYTDTLNGFSLKPPTGGVRVQREKATYVAAWIENDKKTHETLWNLSVSVPELPMRFRSIDSYQEMLQKLAEKGKAKVLSIKTTKASGFPAIEMLGVIPGQTTKSPDGKVTHKEPDHDFRQLWVLVKPGKFILVDFVSSKSQALRLNLRWRSIRSSLTLTNPETTIRQQKENVRRTQEFLWKEFSEAKLRSAIPVTTRWYLIRKGRTPVGWWCIEGNAGKHIKTPGYLVRIRMMLRMPNQPELLVRETLFTDAAFKTESWKKYMQTGLGKEGNSYLDDGARHLGLILCRRRKNTAEKENRIVLPGGVKDIYLPKALEVLLPALLDLKKSVSYNFAEYHSSDNNFVMRIVSVLGKSPIRHRGRMVQAYKIADRVGLDAKPTIRWVDEKGVLLRSETPGGLTAERSTAANIAVIFPKAPLIIKKANLAEKK